MASATPDLYGYLLNGRKSNWMVPDYTAWWQRTCVVWTTWPRSLPAQDRPFPEIACWLLSVVCLVCRGPATTTNVPTQPNSTQQWNGREWNVRPLESQAHRL